MSDNPFKVGDKVRLSKQQYEKEPQNIKDALRHRGFENFIDTYEVKTIETDRQMFLIGLEGFKSNFFIRFFELASKKSVGFIIE